MTVRDSEERRDSVRTRQFGVREYAGMRIVTSDPNGVLLAADGTFAWDFNNLDLYINVGGGTLWASLSAEPSGVLFLDSPPGIMDTPPVGTSYVKIDTFDSSATVFKTTVSTVNNNITMSETGRYLIGYNFVISANANNVFIGVAVFVNNNLIAATEGEVFVKASGDPAPGSFSVPIVLLENDVLDVRVKVGSGTRDLTFTTASLWVQGV